MEPNLLNKLNKRFEIKNLQLWQVGNNDRQVAKSHKVAHKGPSFVRNRVPDRLLNTKKDKDICFFKQMKLTTEHTVHSGSAAAVDYRTL